jgi:hypothetical protein
MSSRAVHDPSDLNGPDFDHVKDEIVLKGVFRKVVP